MEQFHKLASGDREFAGRAVRSAGNSAYLREIAVRAHNEAADFYQKRGNPNQAEDLWRRAAVLDPKNVECRKQLAFVYERSDRVREALCVCQELRDLEPANAANWLSVGLLSVRLHRRSEGLAAIEKAIQLDPSNQRCRDAYEAAKQLR